MSVRAKHWHGWLYLASMVLVLGLCGCSAMPSFRSGDPAKQVSKASPRVQDCGIVSIGSPTKYICDDKVYTSFELAKLRLGQDKAQ